MKSKLLLSSLVVATVTACNGMNVAGMLEAGTTLAQAASISDAEVKALGVQSAKQLDGENRVASANNKYTKRLNKITRNLKTYEGTRLNYKVYLNNEVNAFALPNGDIRVYSGLLDMMTDDEVLFVIGHEIGHVMEGHSKSQARTNLLTLAARQAAASSGQGVVAALSAGQIGELAHKLIDAQYSQSQEYSADSFGLKVLQANNRPKEAAVSALNKLAGLGGGHGIFSSHPEPGNRAKRIANSK